MSLALFSAEPASAASAATCRMLGKHLTNGHCCPTDQTWNGGGSEGGCCPNGMAWDSAKGCAAPSGFGIQFGIDDPNKGSFKTTPCKALGTC